MMRNRTHKLIYRATGVSELYDLASDPRELRNLYGNKDASNLQNDMSARLLNWYVQTSDATPGFLDPRGSPKFPYPLPTADPWAAALPTSTDTSVEEPNPFDYLTINGVGTK